MKIETYKHRRLTKTLFKLADECPTKLYYQNKEEYISFKTDDDFLNALAEGGFQVGALAKCYYPEGVEVGILGQDEAIIQTRALLEKNRVTIFEAAICFEDFFVRVDILKKDGEQLELIEVKSKSYHPAEDGFLTKSGFISSKWTPHLHDVAFQTCIVERAFPQFPVTPFLMLVDKSKTTSVEGLNQRFRLEKEDGKKRIVINGDVSLEALGTKILTPVSVGEYVNMILRGSQEETEETVESPNIFFEQICEYAQYYKRDERFPISIAQKCKSCEFKVEPNILGIGQKSGFKECWQNQLRWKDEDFEKPLIFDVWNFRQIQQLMDQGIYLMEDIPLEESFMKRDKKKNQLVFKSAATERQHLQVVKSCHEKDGKEVVEPDLFNEMEKWRFPLHFIDFETSMVAIPFNKGRPYELIAFQFSCHTIHESGQIEHDEWIHEKPGLFPNFDFLISLKNALEKDEGTIFRYAAHENTILRHIYSQLQKVGNIDQENLPPNPEELLTWIDTVTQWKESIQVNGKTKEVTKSGDRNMVDMWDLVKKYFYHPMMRGSNSIKAVLPSVLSTSLYLKEKYSKPYNSKNYKNMIWWRMDDKGALPVDPYTFLPPLFEDVDISKDQLILENDHIQEGGAAMLAYAKMQFSEMKEEERQSIISGLLKYCELDTLAMVMIYEHWNFLKGNSFK